MADGRGERGQRLKVAVVGSGLIGRSWAMLFAAGGYDVLIYDVVQKQLTDAIINIKVQLQDLSRTGMLRGSLSAEQQYSQIAGTSSLATCVKDAFFIQECVPEQLSLKQELFKELDALVNDKVVLSSSTSSMPISSFTSELKHKEQCIVSHPTNPPFYCPLVEVVPAPYTAPWVTTLTLDVMKKIGQEPVLLKKELLGFALNRIQYALLNETWNLVTSGVISVDDVDKILKHGLGMRYAFMGPLETIHLNALGVVNYCERYGAMIKGISETFDPVPTLGGEQAKMIEDELVKKIPLDQLTERCRWRDQRLAALAKLKNELGD